MVQRVRTLDHIIRDRLRQWPQRPPGLRPQPSGPDAWLRGRPAVQGNGHHPFLKFAGSNAFRTMPDGLWINFGGTEQEPFADIMVIEACSSMTNLLDKRSRFAPSVQSMLVVCPVAWLCSPVLPVSSIPRWRTTGLMDNPPTRSLVMPVRDMRILYGLKRAHYNEFARNLIPHAHEYFVPMDVLTDPLSVQNPELRELLARASAASSFIGMPPPREKPAQAKPAAVPLSG
jgi:hypothetical protein